MDRLREIWKEEVVPSMPARTAKRAAALAADLFAAVTDTIRDAARMPQDRRLTPEHLRLACQQGLAEILHR
jgi:predicted methyltransferase